MRLLCVSLSIVGLAFLTGCASTSMKTEKPDLSQDATKQYAPWVRYSTATDGTVYLALPSSKKEVDKGVYKIWTHISKWKDMTMLKVVDCNSNESMLLKMVGHRTENKVSLDFEESIFEKQSPNSVGQGLINYVCS